MENKYKFNIGDRIVELKLSFFDNPYHYEKCISVLNVRDSNENYFSPFTEKLDPYFSGSNQYSIICQQTGVAMYGGSKYYHLKKDCDIIKQEIEKVIRKYNNDKDLIDSERIKELKNIIANSKEEIKNIKEGNGSFKIGFSRYNRKEHLDKVLKVIDNKLS